jgi:hypothetical protein
MKSEWDRLERRLFWLSMIVALVMLLAMVSRLFR